jgi:cob(I)alamin adenosyltransferase
MGHRLSRITTRTGDAGDTGLGDGSRVPKDSARIGALGDIDELNSCLGLVLAEKLPPAIGKALLQVQHDLFDLGGEVCIPGHTMITEAHVLRLEALTAQHNAKLKPLKEFILPGGTRAAAARTSRARYAVAPSAASSRWGAQEAVGERARQYLNRLSDLLFVLGRALNRAAKARRRALEARAARQVTGAARCITFPPCAAPCSSPRPAARGARRGGARAAVQPREPAGRGEPRGGERSPHRRARRRGRRRRAGEALGRGEPEDGARARGGARGARRARALGQLPHLAGEREGPHRALARAPGAAPGVGRVRAATALVGRLQQELVLASLALSVSDEARRSAENALIAEALAALEERARVVRDAMRAKSYRVKELQIGTGGPPPRPMLAEARPRRGRAAAIEPGTTRLQVTVSGTIQLQ